MPAIDDLDLIRGLLAEPGPSAAVIDRGSAQLEALAAASAWSAPGSRPSSAARWPAATGRLSGRRGLVAAAAAVSVAAVAVTATTLGGTGPGRSLGTGPVSQSLLSPQQVLLTAAEQAARAPATGGRYWRVQERTGMLTPAGTRAHAYDIIDWSGADNWTAKAKGQRSWYVWQELPATFDGPADVAAWHAAGSPVRWVYGAGRKRQIVTLTAQAPGASWQVSDGTVGYIEGDVAYLTAAQFAALPHRAASLKAVLVGYADKTWSAQHPGGGGATVDQLVWSEAVALLTDPVTPQVRAAAFTIMAGLPGVRALGRIRDPLGRTGYGLGLGKTTGTSVGEQFAVIDPTAGVLLGTTIVGHPEPCINYTDPNCAANAPPGIDGIKMPRGTVQATSYYGRSFGAATPIFWDLIVSAGWTSSRPALPPASAQVRG